MEKIISVSLLRRPLETILEERGLMSRTVFTRFVTKAGEENVAVEDLLVRESEIPEEQLFQAIADSYNLPYSDLSNHSKLENLGTQAMEICTQHQLVPLSLADGVITLATSQPNNIRQFEGRFQGIGLRTRFVVSSPRLLAGFFEGLGVKTPDEDLFEGINELAISFEGPAAQTGRKKAVDINEGSELPSIIQLVNRTLILGVSQRASDIHIESTEGGVRIRFRIDGVLADRFELTSTVAAAFISRLLVMAGLDITERMMPQDGSFKASFQSKDIEFRIASMPGLYGQNMTLRILSGGSHEVTGLKNLGLREDERNLIEQYLRFPHGMVLVSGPTGSGKSTTLYALLESLAGPPLKLITIEDPIERRINYVQQIQVRINRNDPDRSLTFARGLRSILRLDPDIIMVGEIRDKETAEIAVQASLTGHLVLSTVHANSAVETLQRMHNIGVDPFLMIMSMNLLLAQRLMRRLCTDCRKPRPLQDREKRVFGASPPEKLYDHVGCAKCLKTGYRGRIGLFEMLPITQNLRGELYKSSMMEPASLNTHLLRDLAASAKLYVREGWSDFQELERVLGPCP